MSVLSLVIVVTHVNPCLGQDLLRVQSDRLEIFLQERVDVCHRYSSCVCLVAVGHGINTHVKPCCVCVATGPAGGEVRAAGGVPEGGG